MSELFKIIISLSLSGTILLVFMMALKRLYQQRLSREWQYYIWLIVVVRMLLPFTFDTTLMGSAFQYFENVSEETIQTNFAVNNAEVNRDTEKNNHISNAETAPLFSNQDVFLKVYENLWILWSAVALAFLIRKITMYQSFVHFVKAGRTEVSEIEILNILAETEEEMGVKKQVELFTNSLISSPMMLGFFHPYIILPNITQERTELAYILRHELTHYKRLDMFYKWLVQITVCLHWFNPFAYRLAKEINKCCELSCDEAIIRTLDGEGKKAYGNTLLNSLNSMGNYKDKLATVMLTEGAEQLKERLEAIMNFKKKSKNIKVAAIGLTMILCMSGAVVGAYASTPKGQTPWSVMGETGNSYVYSQKGYYAEDYIFELGWNISEDASNAYPDKVSLTLYDKSAITVSFDKSCKSESKDSKVLNSLTHLLDRLKSEQDNFSIPLEKPFVVSVKYVGDRDMLTLAEEYYRNDELPQFSAIFQQLDKGVQKEYCIKMINDQKNSFLSSAASGMQSDLIDFCAEKTYQEDKLALFAGIVPQFSKEQLESWIVKASRENKNTFFAVLTKIKNS